MAEDRRPVRFFEILASLLEGNIAFTAFAAWRFSFSTSRP